MWFQVSKNYSGFNIIVLNSVYILFVIILYSNLVILNLCSKIQCFIFFYRVPVGDWQRCRRGTGTARGLCLVQYRHARPGNCANGGRRRDVRRQDLGKDDGES